MADGDGMVGVAALTDGFKLDVSDFGVITVMCELVHAFSASGNRRSGKCPRPWALVAHSLGIHCPRCGHVPLCVF